MGNMDQTVWNVLHGNGFTMTNPAGVNQESRLAVHADFLLILLAPFYLVWSDPKMLLVIQTIVMETGALAVYWIALEKLKNKKKALFFGVSYLLYPPLQRLLLHDFHAVALSTTFLLFAYWFMIKKNYVRFLIFALLAALGKEQVWLITGLMGLYIAFIQQGTNLSVNRKRLLGITIASSSFLIFYFLMWKFIPQVTANGQHFALTYLSDFGDSQNQIIKHILTEPFLTVKTLFAPDRLFYFFQIMIPLGLLSIINPFKLVFAAPDLLINALSSNQLMRQIDYQYNSTIAPFIFISSIEGYLVAEKFLKKISNKNINRLSLRLFPILIAGFVLTASFLWGELPGEKESRFFYFTAAPWEKPVLDKIIKSIGTRYSVSVSNNIGAHLSQREFLYNYPVNGLKADYVLVQLGDPYAWPSDKEQKKVLKELLADKNYFLMDHVNNFYAFRRINDL